MQAAALPKFNFSFLAFFFLIPLFYVLEKQKVKRVSWLFFRFSFLSYLLLLYWIPNVMMHYGGMSGVVSILGLFILAAFLSLFTALAGSLINIIIQRKKNVISFLVIPFIWVAKDLVLEKILSGFPWCSIGYSQYKNIYFVQMAEIGGIHLLTFVVVYFNVLLYLLIMRRDIRPKLTAVTAISIIGLYTTGYFLYRGNESKNMALPFHTAGILQPNSRNSEWLDGIGKDKKLDEFFNDSQALMKQGAEFVIWPEYSVYVYPLQNQAVFERFMTFVKNNVPILAGFTDLKSDREIYNSLMLFPKDKAKFQKYDKIHLTPFGEYLLFRKVLFFVERITDEIGDFTPGQEIHNLELDGHLLATPICYELIFPELVREFTSKGGEVIIITSNDSWYGNTSAPYQLLAMSTLRSIENRRYILRSTTNGISALIAPSGEILYQSPFNAKDTFTAKFKYIKRKTVFMRFGYLFPYFCLLFLVFYFIIRLRRVRTFLKKGSDTSQNF
ncbi:MAG TPA: apolipoprotein N-acyltransferase [Candidatus Deferrimicrobium sp.]|nr:apolipoprotein N-acyltransferase [Candidatus Deferrimicrobium sp.]